MSESMFGKVNVSIKGLTPLMMNRLDIEALAGKSRTSGTVYDPATEALKAAYIAKIDKKEQLYVPNQWLHSCIINTARAYKFKRVSASSLLAGSIRIEPEQIGLGTKEYEIDSRAVNIQNARVVKSRPKILEWAINFSIIYYRKLIASDKLAMIKEILEDAGIRMGIGDYRPQHKGWFGTFTVTKFEVEN